MDRIKNDPAGHYLNKIMANSVWGKWTKNPSSQQELKTCNTIRDYHECLFTGQVKRMSTKLLQVEMKRDRNMEGENHERENSRSGLGGKNAIVGALSHYITSSQTFNDDFMFVGKTKDIPCTRLHADKGCAINTTVPPCELTKIHLMMMAFIHKEIMVESQIKDVFKDHVHKQIEMQVFFHNRIIERWRCEIEFDTASGVLAGYESKLCARE